MATIDRPLSGDALVLDLDEARRWAEDPEILERHGRNARTLVKDGPLRVTLVALAAGGEMKEHDAQGPVTVQPLRGRIRFHVDGEDHDLGPGQLLAMGPGVRHRVSSQEGGAFLLTVAQPDSTSG